MSMRKTIRYPIEFPPAVHLKFTLAAALSKQTMKDYIMAALAEKMERDGVPIPALEELVHHAEGERE
jgi:hypothetical protein